MKDFDVVAIAATACEFLGGWAWALAALAGLWVVLMAVAVRRWRGPAGAPVNAYAMIAGLVAWAAAVLSLPALTGSAFRYVNGTVDWVILLGAGLGAGLAVVIFIWPIARIAAARR